MVQGPQQHGSHTKKRICDGTKYTKAEVLHLKSVFDQHDKDGNGLVTIAELTKALEKEKNLSHHELSAFRTIDINRDGVLTLDEYLRRLYPYANDREFKIMWEWVNPAAKAGQHSTTWNPSPEQLDEIRQIFKMYDSNGNGVIERQELVSLAERCGYHGQDVEDLFNSTDTDKNGTISFDEFVQLMRISYI